MSRKVKVSYGIGAFGKDMVYALVSVFLMNYYNTVLGISASFVGVIFMAARVFDAFNDPFMGVIVAKTNTKLGKFRPWLLFGTIANAVVLFLIFAVPRGLSGTNLMIYISVGYILWGVTYTFMDIPFWSMIPAISKPGKERETISVIARSCSGVGYALPSALTVALVPILGNGDQRSGFSILALIIAVLFILTICITVKNVKETTTVTHKAVGVKEMFSSLIHNDQALVVVVAIIIFNTSLYITQSLALYFFEYDIGNKNLYSIFATVGGAAQILAMMMLPALRKKFSCIKILCSAIVTALAGYLLLFAFAMSNITNVFILCIPAIIIFMGFGLATVLTTIFLADSVDYGEYTNGMRNESVIFSLQTFVVKLASAISALIGGIGIDLVHLDVTAGTNQMSSTLIGLRCIMIIVPMAGLILSILFFKKKYKLTETKLDEISTELKKRHALDTQQN